MPSPTIESTPSPPPQQQQPPEQPTQQHYFDDRFVASVREKLLSQLALVDNNNRDEVLAISGRVELPYCAEDIEAIKRDDWFVRRFLKWEPTTVEAAVKALHQSLQWRKRIQINQWTERTFPAEFYQIAACFAYLPDREGHSVIIVRLRMHKRDPSGIAALETLVRHYFIYVLEQIVTRNPNRGFGLIFDCHRASLSNVDLDMARFIINTLSSHYSGAISYVCIYELPWIFNQIWKMVRSWLDEDAKKIVKFATIANIAELIEPSHLPDYMGGTGAINFRHVPKSVPTAEELFESFGVVNRKDVIKLNQYFQKLIQMS